MTAQPALRSSRARDSRASRNSPETADRKTVLLAMMVAGSHGSRLGGNRSGARPLHRVPIRASSRGFPAGLEGIDPGYAHRSIPERGPIQAGG